MADIETRVRKFIVENFLFGDGAGLEEKTSFLQSGIIDSTGVLELASFLEEEFALVIHDDELVPENFDSIQQVSAYLRRKQQEGTMKVAMTGIV